jgi:hypothetical protein
MARNIPQVKVGSFNLPKVILGYDPFQVYTALYSRPHEKKAIYKQLFSDVSGIVDVIFAAMGEGVDTLGFKRYSNLVKAVDHLRKQGTDPKLIPMIYQIPLKIGDTTVSANRIQATILKHRNYIKQEPAYQEYVSSEEYRKEEAATPLRNEEIRNLKIEEDELSDLLKWFSSKRCLKLVTTCVEFYALTRRLDLLEEIVKICEKLGFKVCAGSHMSNVFDILERENLRFPAYYAPLNKMGFFMLPSREAMLQSLSRIKAPLIAIKPLAGGRIPPWDAFDYIFGLRDDVVCMVGLSSAKEVKETISAAEESLRKGLAQA